MTELLARVREPPLLQGIRRCERHSHEFVNYVNYAYQSSPGHALIDEHLELAARRLGKLFSGFVHQVRVGLGRWEGAGPYVVRAEDRLLQIRLGPGMKLLSLRPHWVAGSAGLECFVHCREGSGRPGGPDDPLVAVYRLGAGGAVGRYPSLDDRSLGILSDSYVAVGIARSLIREAYQRAGVPTVKASLLEVSPPSSAGHGTQARGGTCP